jgi:3',5'-cyclic AMP phosphodiesterase CpdA
MPSPQGGPAPGSSRVLLQISDPHFGTEQPAVVEALVALAEAERPDLVLWTGDITQRARRVQFDAAGRLVQRMGRPTLAVPGNHDVPLFNLAARALWPYAGWRRVFGPALEPVVDDGPWLIQCVDSTRRWRHKHGTLSRAQVRRVADRLRRARPGQVRIVALHHPLHVLRAGDAHDVARAPSHALRTWREAGADLVLGGHIHWPFCAPLPTPDDSLWVALAGTAVSHRVREGIPNSVNLIRVWPGDLGGGLQVERWDHDGVAFRRVACRRRAPGTATAGHDACP